MQRIEDVSFPLQTRGNNHSFEPYSLSQSVPVIAGLGREKDCTINVETQDSHHSTNHAHTNRGGAQGTPSTYVGVKVNRLARLHTMNKYTRNQPPSKALSMGKNGKAE